MDRIGSDLKGVDAVLGVFAGVGGATFDADIQLVVSCGTGDEGAHGRSGVEDEAVVEIELFQVHGVRAAEADLFADGEEEADVAVGLTGVDQSLDGFDSGGDTALAVGTENRRAVGADQAVLFDQLEVGRWLHGIHMGAEENLGGIRKGAALPGDEVVAVPAELRAGVILGDFEAHPFELRFDVGDAVLLAQGGAVDFDKVAEAAEKPLLVDHGSSLRKAFRYPLKPMAELLARALVRDVPDFPKPGILFKDITPVLEDPKALRQVVELLAEDAKARGADVIVGIESRGFLFGVPVALALDLPFALARKLGKLPAEKIREEYALEYGTNTIEMHADAIRPGQKAYLVDDLLATGGTAAAASRLVGRLGGSVVGYGFLIELGFLEGRNVLSDAPVTALMEF